MALQPNWIDITNGAYGEGVSSGQMERIILDGNNVWGAISNNSGMFLYKSTDFGATWTDTNIEVGNHGGGFSGPAFNNSSGVALLHGVYIVVFAIISGTNNLWYTYKYLSDSSAFSDWSLVHTRANGLVAQGQLCASSRPDGSLAIAASYRSSGGRPNVIVKKLSSLGGSWTTISELYSGSSTTAAALQNGVSNKSNGDLYFFTEETITPFGSNPPTTLKCRKLNASDDSISGPYTVDGNIESGYFSVNMGTPDLSGTSLMISNVYHLQDAPTTYAVHKVWFADTSDLSTWTATTVQATADLIYGWSAGDGQTVFSSCVFVSGVPWVYYLTPYPSSLSPYPNWLMYRSSYVSGWTTPELWYDPGATDPVLDPLRAGHNGLDTLANLQLVKGFGSLGPGIAVDVEDYFIGYAGPAISARNYASSGGALANPGNYASL